MDDDGAPSSIAEKREGRTQGELGLKSLAPEYDPSQHGVYLAALESSIEDPRNQNIALSGSYGVGKSSVLQKFAAKQSKVVIEVSFSGLRSDLPPTPVSTTGTANPAAGTKSNQIQKEIVKQLLYREPPAKTPASKYRRPETFQPKNELAVTALVSSALVGLAYIAGFLDRALSTFHFIPPLAALPIVLIWIAVAALIYGLRFVLHNRVFIEKLSAGPATIALSAQSSTFFDEYLDEIVYFFQASRRRFVIFEDLDRFEDYEIFQSLGALNTLLNRSEQLSEKPIVFIYAIRDSIFQSPSSHLGDAAEAEVERANRTKFFDLVIPMVPFVSTRNARDVMTTEIARRHFDIASELVDLSAKHIADMRLILNVINEFTVFDAVLKPGSSRAPGLTSNKLFALMLYKNVHLFDFEQIRLGKSELDDLYEAYRSFITAAAEDAVDQASLLTSSTNKLKQQRERAIAFGTAVETSLTRASEALGLPSGYPTQIALQGHLVTPAELREPATWKKIAADQLGLNATLSVGHTNQPFALAFSFLQELTDSTLPLADWVEEVSAETARLHAHYLAESDRISHLSMEALLASPDISIFVSTENTLTGDQEDLRVNFSSVLDKALKSELAKDLVRAGHLDEYFGFYAAQYHATRVSTNAMNFIIRRVDRGVSEPLFKLTPADVESVLRERPESLRSRAGLNVNLIDQIVLTQDLSAELVSLLTASSAESRDFLRLYFEVGTHRPKLVSKLAPVWVDILVFIAEELAVSDALRVALFSEAIDGLSSGTKYSASDSVRLLVEDNAAILPVLHSALSPSLAALAWLTELEPRFPVIDELGPQVRAFAINHNLYRFTNDNLVKVTGRKDISLDSLFATSERTYEYALRNLETFLDIQQASTQTPFAVRQEHVLVKSLNIVAASPAIERLITSTPATCKIEVLHDVPADTWQALARHHRMRPTAANLIEYIEQFGGLDDDAIALIRRRRTVDKIQDLETPARAGLAIAILGATNIKDTDRARIARSLLGNDQISAERVPRQDGPIYGLLLGKGVIPDTAETFSATKGLDWSTREALIAKSAQFANYVTPAMLTPAEIGNLVRSTIIVWNLKKFVFDDLATWAKNLTGSMNDVGRVAYEAGLVLPTSDLVLLAQKKVTPLWVVANLLRGSEKRSAAEIESVLTVLGGKYAQLTSASGKRPNFSNNVWHTRLFDLLIPFGKVSRYDAAYWDKDKLVVRMNG